MAVGNKVSVGRISCGAGFESFPIIHGRVGVTKDGWKGVGVGVALGAEVMRMNGSGACSGAAGGLPHEEIRTAKRAVSAKMRGGFIYELGLQWKMMNYCVGVGNAVGLEVWVGTGVGVAGTGVWVGTGVRVNGRTVSVSGSVR